MVWRNELEKLKSIFQKQICFTSILLIGISAFSLPRTSLAQDEIGHLEVYGQVLENKKPIRDASIKVYEGKKFLFEEKSNNKGQFKLKFDFDHEYRLKIEKEGYISATWYEFKTTLLKDDYKYWVHGYEIVEELFPNVDGVDKNLLENRTVYIDFDNRFEGFVVNLTKTGGTFERNRELKKQVEEILKNIEKYNKAIAEADLLFSTQKFEKAIESYQEASAFLPNKVYPKDKIKEINEILEAMRNKEENYRRFIADADRSFNSLQYERALGLYQKASALKPEEQYPKVQIDKINLLLNEMKNKQAAYDEAIAQADENFNNKAYADAKPLYEKASNIFPTEPYPKDQIRKINSILANQTEQLEAYNKAIADGDRNLGTQNYAEAKNYYVKASELFPDKPYPKNKIAEIDKILADLQGKRAAYDQAIAQADAAFEQKEYKKAQTAYQTASNILPDEQYPKDKLNQIAAILAKMQNQQEAYDNFIALADQAFNAKNYPSAKTNYQQALGVFPDKQYPKDKIAEIDRILADAKARDDAYNKAISQADYLYNQKNYPNALTQYQQASNIKPEEQYPKDRINEINKMLSDQKDKENAYNQAIAQADQYFNQKAYQDAKSSYQVALGILPEKQYPKDKIAQINSLLANQQKLEDDYSNAIAEADARFSEQAYKEARPLYVKASQLKPSEVYPKNKIAEIDKLLAELQNKQQAYQNAIAQADKFYNEKKWEQAKEYYQQASDILPQEQYPKDRISEINGILASILSQQQNYDRAIQEGDKAFNEKRYQPAISAYQTALGIFPDKEYPQNRINQINQLLEELKNKEEAYKQAVAQGDIDFGSQQYENAKTQFEKAYGLFPERTYPKEKLDEINKILADKLSNQQAYDRAIAAADKAFNEKSYDVSKTNYQSALRVFPDKQYPKDRITEIDRILAQLAEINKQYDDAILKGDNAFNAKTYVEAKGFYQRASQLKPNEQYPKDKLNQIDLLLANQQQKEQAYNQAIAQADQALNNKDYQPAKSLYQKALGIFPSKEYPAQKISEIDGILTDLQAKRDKYNQVVANADKLFNSKSYESARAAYQEASNILSTEQYPKDQISEIDRILAQQLADQQQKENAYNQAIAQADQAFNNKDYQPAKSLYQKALGIFPSKEYPAQKISEIDGILADIQAKRDRYNQVIANADKLFNSKSYESARAAYQEASNILPTEQYPKDQISEINRILSQQLADQQQKENAYNQAIAQADQAFNNKDYQPARSLYQKALGIFPGKEYPAQKISEIDGILADIQAKRDKYNQVIANADKLFNSKSYESAKGAYQEASSIFPDEQYPKDRIASINQIVSDLQAKQAAYDNAIAQADQAFNTKTYDKSKQFYQQASTILPEKTYPKERIKEIEQLMAEQNKRNQYESIIAKADNDFRATQYQSALNGYQNASNLYPSEQYPKDKINEINQLLQELEGKRNEYNKIIAEADDSFNSKIYDKARNRYQEALGIFPNEQYPKDKINEINTILNQLALVDKQYNEAISLADANFEKSNYEEAKRAYISASNLKPNEAYPKERIEQIDKLLADMKQKEEDYNKAITEADKFFTDRSFTNAKNAYTRASTLFPDREYPKKKIKEINDIISLQQGDQQAYNRYIAQGDQYMRNKSYDLAIQSFNNALKIRPNEKYPKDKIAEINGIIADNKAIQKFYARGYLDVVNNITIDKNQEKKFNFISFDQRKLDSYAIIKLKNLSGKPLNVFLNYGKGLGKNGGFTFKIDETSGAKEYKISLSAHAQWITQRNNWLSLYPAGGAIEIESIKIYFGN